jgi:hypothetical protein
MATKKQEPTTAAGVQLADLHRIPGLVIEGGKRPLGLLLQDHGDTYQPQIALWVDSETGMVLGTAPIDPRQSADGGVSEAVGALVGALTGPLPGLPTAATGATSSRKGRKAAHNGGTPLGLPERVRVNDTALDPAIRGVLGPLGVEVEYRASLPSFDEAFASLSESLGANPDGSPPKSFAWDIDSALLPPLFKAAAAYARLAPWQYMPDHPPLAVDLGREGPEDGVETLYVSILGAAGEVFGASFYFDLDGLRTHMREGAAMMADDPRVDAMIDQMRQAGAPVDEVPPEMLRTMVGGLLRQGDLGQIRVESSDLMAEEAMQRAQVDALVFSFDPADELNPTYLQWLEEQGIKVGKRQQLPSFFRSLAGQEPRDMTGRETRALTLGIEAVSAFFKQHGTMLRSGFIPVEAMTIEARVGSGQEKRTVAVTFPAPGFDWDEDDLPPATPEQAATLYRFQVKLAWRKTTWRRIEMRGDQTLQDLHNAIQDAFEWDDDHLYAFFLSGRAWDSSTEYASPFNDDAERFASEYRLAWLPLRPKQQFLYIFDFGDELRHLIKVEAIVPNGVQEGMEYPRITERQGENEPQYPGAEEWEE